MPILVRPSRGRARNPIAVESDGNGPVTLSTQVLSENPLHDPRGLVVDREQPQPEKRELKAIEEHLAEEDPAFAVRLTRKPPPHYRVPRRVLFVVLLLLTYTAGLALLVVGVALASAVLVVLGIGVTAVFPVRA